MTLAELYELIAYGEQNNIIAKSAYNGKILCKRFNPKKHVELAQREVRSMWSSIKLNPCGLSAIAQPVLECYVDGEPEWRKENDH